MEIGPLGIEFALCTVCKGVFDTYWLDAGVCINCGEIEATGSTMMEDYIRMEDCN